MVDSNNVKGVKNIFFDDLTKAMIDRRLVLAVELKNVFHWSNFMPQSSYLITYN